MYVVLGYHYHIGRIEADKRTKKGYWVRTFSGSSLRSQRVDDGSYPIRSVPHLFLGRLFPNTKSDRRID